jgi:hypothetical protein
MPAPVLQFKRGVVANLPGLRAGEPGFATDSYDLYVGLTSATSTNKIVGSGRFWTNSTASTGSGVNLVEGTDNGEQFLTLKSPDTLSGISTYVMPASGSANQILTVSSVSNGVHTLAFSNPAASSFTLAADSGSNDTFNTGETLTFSGGEGIDTTVSDNAITIAAEDASDSNKGVASFDSGDFSVSSGDVTLSDAVVKSVTTDSGALTPSSHGFSVLGGEGMDVTHSGTTVTVAGEDATSSNKGIASFDSDDFSVSSGAVTLGDSANGAVLAISATANETTVSRSNGTVTIGLPDDVTVGGGLTATTFTLAGVAVTAILDEDDLTSNRADALATQQSIKAYVDAVDTTLGIDADSGGASTVATSQTLTVSGTSNEVETSVSGQTITIGLPNTVNVTTAIDVPTIEATNLKARDGTAAITITNSTGAVSIANSMTISGDLFVNGTTTEVNTSTLSVEDTLVELGKVDGAVPASDVNKDLGLVFHYYSGSAKKAAVYWDDSTSRIVVASEVSESSGVLTNDTSGSLEIGALYLNDCAGTSQVISCSGTTRSLENITIDAGSF